ncbi:alpha beta-hydrolase [Rhizoctonia solani]|uniref:Alpha beta-hydrolase n=1 Tax=Rhizoctonia solani TaxID=456999 RepID=A0A8H7IEE9_9AGAM|nr:alpha beta-hydrolase [Rhizoctonia solani]
MRLTLLAGFAVSLAARTQAAPTGTNTSAPVVSLPYARYQGFHNETSGLDVFLGIRYAQAPVGERFTLESPKSPIPVKETLQATSQPAKCFQCLRTTVEYSQEEAPVLVWIHGGGYFAGYAASYDPTTMIQARIIPIVDKFLSRHLTSVAGRLPPRIRDQEKWNAECWPFGYGIRAEMDSEKYPFVWWNPDDVTIWGESAGAGGVMMQVVANGGKTAPPLFKRAIASSTYVPPNYRYDDPQAELQYASLVSNTGCANATNTLACLRSLDYATLAAGATQLPRPVVDGSFLTQRPQLSLAKKQVNGHNVDEGRIFVSQDANSTVQSWMQQQFPDLTQQNRTVIENAYQVFASSGASRQTTTVTRYAIFMKATSLGFDRSRPQGLFAVPPSLHSLDLNVYFPGSSSIQPAQPFSQSFFDSFVGALLSFILTGTPNSNPINKSINPNWPLYDSKNPKGMKFNVTASGDANAQFEAIDSALRQRCSIWRSLALTHPNKGFI